MWNSIGGLIVKDLILIERTSLKIILFLLALYLAIPLMFSEESTYVLTMSGILCMLFAILPISTFSCDESARWNRYALSMPVTRQTLVLSKYLFSGLMLVCGALLASAYLLLIGVLRDRALLEALPVGCGVFIVIGAAATSILLPIIFRFGPEKGRLVLIGVAALMGVAGYIVRGISLPAHPALYALTVVIGVALLIYVSYLISLRIFQRKEIG